MLVRTRGGDAGQQRIEQPGRTGDVLGRVRSSTGAPVGPERDDPRFVAFTSSEASLGGAERWPAAVRTRSPRIRKAGTPSTRREHHKILASAYPLRTDDVVVLRHRWLDRLFEGGVHVDVGSEQYG